MHPRHFDHWAFDIQDLEHRGRLEIGLIPRPLKLPAEKLVLEESISAHRLMERTEAIDVEISLPFAWYFLMTHGTGSIRTPARRSVKGCA
ncbi:MULTISPECIES: hypothetical protein [unclassified Mesorhizobium]|uniref:hypothetical protein n=1 Tax=unclassified Mesorhizobium TaxID=325217 RepID=UPI001936402A|nr:MULTISPECIES: hypothetical protein [unclassified Mesorhizobium]BCH12259.1 hypothetical protein MesoLj131c_65170 [Mesorhizobium sp. 131-3-5]